MFRKKRQTTHFERGMDDTGKETIQTTHYKADEEFNPVEEIEADTDVRAMIREEKELRRDKKMESLIAERSILHEKKEMKLADLRQKKEMKSLKGDIRKMKYAPLYKTGSGLMKMGTAVRERDSGFAGGGQEKVVLDEGAIGKKENEKSDFFSFGRGSNVDWGSSKKTELDFGLGGGNIDFGLAMGQKSAPKKRRKKSTKKKTTKKKTTKRRKK